jgi:hypothetical protein
MTDQSGALPYRDTKPVGAADFPPAAACVVVLMIDDKAGAAQQGADPAQAVVAVVVILLQAVANQKSLGRALMHVDAEDRCGGRTAVAGGFFLQRMAPIRGHAVKALGGDQLGSMPLRVLRDRLVPVLADQSLAAQPSQPLEGPLVVSAKIVNADHVASRISPRSCGGTSAWRGRNVCRQRPLPPATRTVNPAGAAMASLTKKHCWQKQGTICRW